MDGLQAGDPYCNYFGFEMVGSVIVNAALNSFFAPNVLLNVSYKYIYSPMPAGKFHSMYRLKLLILKQMWSYNWRIDKIQQKRGEEFIVILVVVVFLLTWIGARPVEEPFILTGQLLTLTYFSYFLFLPVINRW